MQKQRGVAPPVFVDRTGRRRRLTVIAGTAMGLGLLTSLGLILAGLFFDSAVPIPGWSETKVHPPIEAGVDAPGNPRPATSPSRRPDPATATTSSRPSSAPTATRPAATRASTAPAPQPSASVPGQGDEHRSSAKPSRTPGKP
ncbi:MULTISPECIES: hypothetical protein [Micromonospora]|nr:MULTISPECIES: hypothetical protein [Micromonospora]NES15792.1 hypothetical protein [Micromonospora sp. PPF5-17B]NES38059.1 hypothetical protein [Micromonospora solifontis]NES56638.1 hypothetical protein [Micromonospora sp. PPF5-6]